MSKVDEKPEAQDAIFDRIMQIVGDRGPFQKRFNYIFNIGLVICASMVYMNIILALNVPTHWCNVLGREGTSLTQEQWKNLTLPKDTDNRGVETHSSCQMYKDIDVDVLSDYWAQVTENPHHNITFPFNETTSCLSGYEYDRTYYERTVVTQEDWVCDKDLYVTNTFVFNRLGEVVGTFFIGQLGDTLGRRLTYYLSVFVIVVGRFMTMLSGHSFVLFSVAAIVGSFTSISIFQAPLIIAMETSDAEARGHIAMLQCLGWTMGMCILPMIFWVVKDWIWFLTLTTLPALIFVCFPKYMIESPRWLANRKRYVKCAEMLNRIAEVNGKKDVHFTEESVKGYLEVSHNEAEKVYGMMSLFANWRLGKNTILLVIAWTISSTAYLTIVLNSSRMGGNPFLNFLWQSAIEMPAYIIGRKMSDTIGRRFTNCISFIMSALVCIPVILMVKNTELDMLSTGFTVLIKFSISINFFAVNLQAMETYPTCLRQTGISIGAIVANGFGMFGPYIVFLGTNYDARYPFMILLGFFILGSCTQLFLPETLHQKLPETLHEAQKFGKEQPFWYLPKVPVKDDEEMHEKSPKENGVTEKLNQPQFAP